MWGVLHVNKTVVAPIWLERTLGKLAEERENVSEQWGSHWIFVAEWASYQNYPAEEKRKNLAKQREARNINAPTGTQPTGAR